VTHILVAVLVASALPPVRPAPSPREHRVVGIVMKVVAPGRFAVRAANGRTVLVTIDSGTRIIRGESTASAEDVQVGAGVLATFEGPATVDAIAREVVLDVCECVVTRVLSAPSPQIEMTRKDGRTFVVTVDDRTKVLKGPSREPVASSEVKERALVVARLAPNGPVTRALEIEVPVVGGVVGTKPLPPPPPPRPR
jgi:hypothetical protein